jgi:hypothetical protein
MIGRRAATRTWPEVTRERHGGSILCPKPAYSETGRATEIIHALSIGQGAVRPATKRSHSPAPSTVCRQSGEAPAPTRTVRFSFSCLPATYAANSRSKSGHQLGPSGG